MKHRASIWLVISAALATSPAAAFDHTGWNSLLQTYVDDLGRVAYRSLAEEAKPELDEYLAAVAVADPRTMTEKEALAFYLNAYNALVFKEDFERDAGSLGAFLARWAPRGQPACLATESCSFDFIRYDWTLNTQPGERLD